MARTADPKVAGGGRAHVCVNAVASIVFLAIQHQMVLLPVIVNELQKLNG